jgi:uroporphyrin-III C-methyltransferase
MKDTSHGKVFLIGAGPGDPDLLTVKALRLLQAADVVVFDRLVSPAILALIPGAARQIDVGKAAGCHKLPQSGINALLVQLACEGACVVRLKGGDPLIFGRGSEEAAELALAGVPFEYVPGITSAQGAAATTGVPLTHRGLASSVRYVTGHRARDAALDLDWSSLAARDTTLVIYMGAMNLDEIAHQLVAHGLPGDTPAMAVASATTPAEAHAVATLATLSAAIAARNLSSPVLIVIGRVVSLYRADRVDHPEALYA